MSNMKHSIKAKRRALLNSFLCNSNMKKADTNGIVVDGGSRIAKTVDCVRSTQPSLCTPLAIGDSKDSTTLLIAYSKRCALVTRK
jgi:hypothetical protein